jgi:hypothetical protein
MNRLISTFHSASISTLHNVGYLSSRFEYFLNRFAIKLAPVRPKLDQDRTRQALVPTVEYRRIPPMKSDRIRQLEIVENQRISMVSDSRVLSDISGVR